jgi:hypothetical protein
VHAVTDSPQLSRTIVLFPTARRAAVATSPSIEISCANEQLIDSEEGKAVYAFS